MMSRSDSQPAEDARPDDMRPEGGAPWDARVREALWAADLDADVAAAEQVLAEADDDAHRLTSHVRAAARAAFAASVLQETVAQNGAGETQTPEPVAVHATPMASSSRPSIWHATWTRAAAAVLLAASALIAFWGGGAEPVEAGIRLASLRRIDEAASVRGLPAVERGRVAGIGEVFQPGRDELLALELGASSLMVLRDGDVVRVDDVRCDPSRTGEICFTAAMRDTLRRELGTANRLAAQDALFHLRAGEIRVSSGGKPVPLWIGARGLLVVLNGAVHMRADAGVTVDAKAGTARVADGAPVPAVAVAAGSRAVFVPLDGRAVELSSEERVLLTDAGVEAVGPAAASLFRELQFFGGVVPPSERTVDVPARRWRVQTGKARLRAEGLRFDAAAPLRLRWRVPSGLEAARSLRVALRGPAGLAVRIPALGLERQVEASSSDEPGARVVEFVLPEDWAARLQGRPVTLDVSSAGTQAPTGAGWFEGAVFVVPAPDRVTEVRQ